MTQVDDVRQLKIDTLEVIARALCVDDDVDPDDVDYDRTGAGRPNWHCVQGTADAILTALSEKGMVIVPKEPTEAMLDAGDMAYVGHRARMAGIYRAMLSASDGEAGGG